MESGIVFNIQRYSVHDGPGIRTTVFLKGCPLRCAWCHNPEGISATPELYFVESLCLGCGECAKSCGATGASLGRVLPVPVAGCQLCGACVETCPVRARRMVGNRMTTAEMMQIALRDRVFYEQSGGGITFSGGEPLAQPEFLLACLKECRSLGLHTAVDTCGFAPLETLLKVAQYADIFLYDLKVSDETAHRRWTGASNRVIIDNLRELGKAGAQIWLRIPLVPGVNDSDHEARTISALAAEIPSIDHICILPFHREGTQKRRRLGSPMIENVAFEDPLDSAVQRMAVFLGGAGYPVRVGG